MNKPPLFSIIIPAYNAGETLAQTLDSIISQEGDCAWEAIVVDDGSNDSTYDICLKYANRDERIKAFSRANGGTGAALNDAARHATGEFLVQLGADDLLDSTYMRKTADCIRKHPHCDIYASNAFRLFEDGMTVPCLKGSFFNKERNITFEDMIWSNKIYGTAAIRHELFDRVGGFHPGFYNEDYDLWLRLLIEGGKAYYQPEYLAYYRVVHGQKTEETIRVRLGDCAILKSLFANTKVSRKQRFLLKLSYKQLQLKIVMKKMLGMH